MIMALRKLATFPEAFTIFSGGDMVAAAKARGGLS
jgi:hypothetical protein